MRHLALLSCLAFACTASTTIPPSPNGDPQGDTATGGDSAAAGDPVPSGDSGNPLDLPRLSVADLQFQGAFRLPATTFGASDMNYAQGPLEYDAANNSIFIVGHSHQQAIAEFTVPALVNSSTVTDLEMAASPVQGFATVLDRVSNPQALDRIGGMELVAGELLVNGYEYYDAAADNDHTTLVVRDASDLAGSTVDGYFQLSGRAHASGWISPVPPAWQPLLGGSHITGNSSGQPIIGRLSVGPSAFAVDPFDIVDNAAVPTPVPTAALLDFSLDHPLHDDLSNDSGNNDIWTHLSRAIYGFIVPGTRTYATFGHTGGHATGVCYKCTPVGATSECGGYCANNVNDYALYYWFWDVRDLVDVRAGTVEPYAVQPYAYGELTIPFATDELGGGSFDPSSGRLFLSAQFADHDQGTYSNPPVVMVFTLP